MLYACPCCGFETLPALNQHEICAICWWEDDGQDNNKADIVFEGPNYHLSLTQARYNFLKTGRSDPDRLDLEPADFTNYIQGRFRGPFALA